MSSDTPRRAQDVLLFWFGPRPYTPERVTQHARLWFGSAHAPELRAQTDELIRQRFAAMLGAAERGDCADWESSPRRRLALIVLLDQFSRHVYRGSPHAFDQDAHALRLAISGMQLGADAALDPIERVFFYMPLMHAESTDVQEESVAAFRRLNEEAPPEHRAWFEDCLAEAVGHQAIIRRFGRFPSRNTILGRASGAEELIWLADRGQTAN